MRSLIISSFKVLRIEIAQCRVPANSIVIAFDVGEGFGPCLWPPILETVKIPIFIWKNTDGR